MMDVDSDKCLAPTKPGREAKKHSSQRAQLVGNRYLGQRNETAFVQGDSPLANAILCYPPTPPHTDNCREGMMVDMRSPPLVLMVSSGLILSGPSIKDRPWSLGPG
jgi:hypothetical protein